MDVNLGGLHLYGYMSSERIKNYHIFDQTVPSSLTHVAEQIFFVCTVLTNFLPPLCSFLRKENKNYKTYKGLNLGVIISGSM